ncbi:MAG: cytochrome P450 [bacterium]
MSSKLQEFEGFNLIEGADYAARGYPHPIWELLRHEDPVHWYDKTAGRPFWAITRHDDIIAIGKDPERFISGPRLVLQNKPEPDDDFMPPTLIQLDPPKHGDYRSMAIKRFTPGRMRQMHPDIERIAREIVDELLAQGDEIECDFVEKVAAPLPIAVIAWMLGVPREDWRLLFDWTNRIIGASDPEFQSDGMDASQTAQSAMIELFGYFTELSKEKKKNPQDDLTTLFTQMEYEGEPLPDMDVMTWCLIIVVAGNETTRNATTGGMLAFIEHQAEMRKLQSDLSLMKPAVEEIVRWTSPIIHFARTATCDVEIRGRKIREGEAVGLFYPSANRDETVFDDPYSFRIDRQPNHHLGFGQGEHFCLGAHIARLEMEFAYKYLLPKIEEVELAGDIERLNSALVGGVKRLPIRLKLRR